MINRRRFIQAGTGALLVPGSALRASAAASAGESGRIVVYNAEYAECRAFAEETLTSADSAVQLNGDIGTHERSALRDRLLTTPSVMIGMTTEENAFQITLLAADAFHHELLIDKQSIAVAPGEALVTWMVSPVTERAG